MLADEYLCVSGIFTWEILVVVIIYHYDLLQPHQRHYEAPPVYYTVSQVPQLVRVKTVSQQVLNIDLVVGVVIILSWWNFDRLSLLICNSASWSFFIIFGDLLNTPKRVHASSFLFNAEVFQPIFCYRAGRKLHCYKVNSKNQRLRWETKIKIGVTWCHQITKLPSLSSMWREIS